MDWKLLCPVDPWGIQDLSLISTAPLIPHVKTRSLRTVADLPDKVLMMNTIIKKILYFHCCTWNTYQVKDPGWGIFSKTKWQREGVFLQDNKILWRDPVTLGLYCLVKKTDYKTCSLC